MALVLLSGERRYRQSAAYPDLLGVYFSRYYNQTVLDLEDELKKLTAYYSSYSQEYAKLALRYGVQTSRDLYAVYSSVVPSGNIVNSDVILNDYNKMLYYEKELASLLYHIGAVKLGLQKKSDRADYSGIPFVASISAGSIVTSYEKATGEQLKYPDYQKPVAADPKANAAMIIVPALAIAALGFFL